MSFIISKMDTYVTYEWLIEEFSNIYEMSDRDIDRVLNNEDIDNKYIDLEFYL